MAEHSQANNGPMPINSRRLNSWARDEGAAILFATLIRGR
jgi:hypothetical protein